MKNTLYFLVILTCITCLITSCTKPTEGCFYYSPTNYITTTTKVTFDASCTKYGGYSYNWDFGDGTPDTTLMGVSSVTHTFSTSGTYIVTLRARRKDGVVLKENDKYITKRNVTVQ
jgi:PKD repeat protein